MPTVSTRRRPARVLSMAAMAAWVVAGSIAAAPRTGADAPQKTKTPAASQQAPPGSPTPAQATGSPGARPAVGTAQEAGYSYRPEGRRDPFVSLIQGLGMGPEIRSSRSEGLAGVLVAELTLKGILYSRGAYLALVQGPDTRTYIARQNDRLADGTIRAITADGLVILQEVNDPLSLTKQREVAKTLRALEGVK